jgi:SAM-dependent methyltransferase
MSSHASPSPHLGGAQPSDQHRLERLSDALDPASLDRLGLRGGEKVLDVGAGVGLFARRIAKTSGRPVVCVEQGESSVYRAIELATAAGETDLIDLRQGDAAAPPLTTDEWGSFDVVHARFALGELTSPQAGLEQLVRALAPGGRLVLTEGDYETLRLWPAMPAVDELWRALIRACIDQRRDPYLGRKLVAMLRVADLELVGCGSIDLGGCSGSPQWLHLADHFVDLIADTREEILGSSAIAGDLFDEVVASFREWTGRADAALWFPLCWAEGRK